MHPAAISVGRRPTFYEPGRHRSLVEAYLLDFDGDLYGEAARVSFVGRLRDEQQFDSVEALIAQMHLDVAEAERVLWPADHLIGRPPATHICLVGAGSPPHSYATLPRLLRTCPTKQAIIAEHRLHDSDTGSPEVQIALLTDRITHLTEHLKVHRGTTTPGGG